ncbi:DNRLRE domain-containing protein [Spongiactinospora sp. TRM90649]|uniref:fibronectin type III domain-containing protein n=1 Tax=Spongiactinospora sp. TRM90649 TaxID=3031114 RepID=UPI0023F6CAC6|nr:DNRLRE domain-containing protein [Spongiactinospora sp. TRM90649]MDF5751681.1 DNRLRE domain-containing protein [Spongiactinospora sp. TRM90649]
MIKYGVLVRSRAGLAITALVSSLLAASGGPAVAADALSASSPAATATATTSPSDPPARRVRLPRAKDPAPSQPSVAQRRALQRASQGGRTVEVVEEATESSATWARPDGTLTTDLYAGPARINKAGRWQWIDTTLTQQGATLRPRIGKADMEISSGGDGPLIRFRHPKGTFGVGWPTPLPKPAINGATATYRNAAGPGADLLVTALPTGFTHDVLLRERPAGPVEIRLPLQLSDLKIRPAAAGRTGAKRLELTDAAGKVLASTSQPMMRDNGTAPALAASDRHAAVATTIERDEGGPVMVLRPDPAFLAEPAIRYPVRVAAATPLGVTTDAWVSPRWPGSNADSNALNVGKWASGEIARSYLKFNLAPVNDAIVDSAVLSLRVYQQSACTGEVSGNVTKKVQVRRVTEPWDTATLDYGNEPAATDQGAQLNTGCDPMTLPVTAIVKKWLTGTANHGLQLKVPDESVTGSVYATMYSQEIDAAAYRPKLTVNHNTKPEVPTVSVDSSALVLGTHAVLPSTTVNLAVTARSHDGGPVDYEFIVKDPCCPQPGVSYLRNIPSGQSATRVINLRNPDSLKVQVRACRGTVCSGYTPEYRITTDAPQVPNGLSVDLTNPARPILHGIVSRPSLGELRARFYLYDAGGNTVGTSPMDEVTASSGETIALEVPEGLARPGQNYSWTMDACVDSLCTAKASAITFTVPQPPAPRPEGREQIVLSGDDLTIRTAETGAQACAGAACPLTVTQDVRLGTRLSTLRVDSSAVPAGSIITSAILKLGQPTCGSDPCPAQAGVSTWEPAKDLPLDATGAQVLAHLEGEARQTAPASAGEIDITDFLQLWRGDDGHRLGLVLRVTDAGNSTLTFGGQATPISAVIRYDLPTSPGAVEGLQARAGDGGVLITWAEPQELHADTNDIRFESEVLDGQGQAVRTVETTETKAVVNGLGNGTAYTVRARAVTPFGAGPWSTTGQLTPAPVPGGPQKYLDAVQQYVTGRESLLSGRYQSVDEAVSASSQSDLFATVLRAEEAALVGVHTLETRDQISREVAPITLKNTLVTATPGGGAVVQATIEGSVTFIKNKGRPDEVRTIEPIKEAGDFEFAKQGAVITLSKKTQGNDCNILCEFLGGRTKSAEPPPPGLGRSGERAFYASAGGGFTKGRIRYSSGGRGGYLEIGGEVKSTWKNCANARTHSIRYTIHVTSEEWGDVAVPVFRWEAVPFDFLIKPVCGLNKSRSFGKSWQSSTSYWWDVWMGVQARNWSGWK